MNEKFSDYESVGFLNQEGEFEFEITSYELKESSTGSPMAVFGAKSEAGQTTIYHTLLPTARWSYNNLIKACLNLNTKAKIDAFECDYETIGKDLIGKKFIGCVEKDSYQKEVKAMKEDGTYETRLEDKISYKIKSYAPVA